MIERADGWKMQMGSNEHGETNVRRLHLTNDLESTIRNTIDDKGLDDISTPIAANRRVVRKHSYIHDSHEAVSGDYSMFSAFDPGISFWWDLIWQSTAFLTLGIAASAAFSRWPARAHRILVLAIIAAIGTPLLSKAIRVREWGLLSQPVVIQVKSEADPGISKTTISGELVSERSPQVSNAQSSGLIRIGHADNRIQVSNRGPSNDLTGRLTVSSERDIEPVSKFPPIELRNGLITAWIVASLMTLVSFIVSFVTGCRIIRHSMAVTDPELKVSAAAAAKRMGIEAEPIILESDRVRCPAIWCWSRRPILLIPASFERSDSPIDWTAVFSHEIAHWRRLDHATTMLGEMLLCLMPWNPLVWWTKSRLSQFAELSCDDWVLASGTDSADYADSLLKLVPRRGNAMALAAVSTKSGLIARIRHILDDHRSSPRTGTVWTLACGTAVAMAIAAVALAQQGSAASSPEKTATDSKERTAKGQVLGPDGEPVAGAKVYWVAHLKSSLSHMAMPRDDDRSIYTNLIILSRSTTDSNGRFEVSSKYGPDDFTEINGISSNLVTMADGFGIDSRALSTVADPLKVTIRMQPEKVISGRLLTPSGMPAPGVRVTLDGFRLREDKASSDGMFIWSTTSDSTPEYWVPSTRTDSAGRFSLHGVPQNAFAYLLFWSQDFAVDIVTVSTHDGDLNSKKSRTIPVRSNFTHTLEPARPVQGRVTDKATGKPLQGIVVELSPLGSTGGKSYRTRTDNDGRYRISGHSTGDIYITTVYPPSNSGYLDAKDWQEGWPAGAKFLEKNFELEKGRLVTGRVIDLDSKLPISGAAVLYQPARKNKNNVGNHDFGNTTLTDTDGRFSITTIPGEGSLIVESAEKSTIRTRVESTHYGRVAYPHGQLKIDVPLDGTLPPVEIALRKGVSLEAKAIGPDGNMINDFVAFYPGIDANLIDVWNNGQKASDGVFRIPCAAPDTTYRVYFLALDERLGAVADLKYDPNRKEPFEIRLQPTAKIKGKLLNPDGTPAAGGNAIIYVGFDSSPEDVKQERRFPEDNMTYYAKALGNRLIDVNNRSSGEDGCFEYEALIPGAWYELNCQANDRMTDAPTPVLKPGEVYDMGNITLKEINR
jgi:beta-lactamase regulating signal transducer with metallopeptidase domain